MNHKINIIDEGLLSNSDGSNKKYEILHGWDIELSQNVTFSGEHINYPYLNI